MRTAYRVLAHLIAFLVVVQAAAIAWALSGLTNWVSDGGTLDSAAMESGETLFAEVAGFMVHGINGMMLIPLVAVVLLVVSFFAKLPRGVAWAAAVLALVVVQVLLGMFLHGASFAGLLHGANAMLLFVVALQAGLRTRAVPPVGVDGPAMVRATG